MLLQYLSGAVQICGRILSFSCGCFWSFASLAIPTPPSPSLSLSVSLALVVMRCGWAETRPHVSAGSAASSAPIIAALPWHRAQRQRTARHLTAASHAWTPDTVTARTKSRSLVLKYTTIRSRTCVYKHDGEAPRAWDGTESQLLLVMRDKQSENVSHVFAKGKASTVRPGLQSWKCTVESRRDANLAEYSKIYGSNFKLKPRLACTCQLGKLQTVTSFPTNASQQPCIWKSCVGAVGWSLCCCVLPSAAQGICFRANVLIIPQPARVGGLLTHARAIIDRLEQMQAWASPPPEQTVKRGPTPPLHPNTLHVHLKTHMYSECLWMTLNAAVL